MKLNLSFWFPFCFPLQQFYLASAWGPRPQNKQYEGRRDNDPIVPPSIAQPRELNQEGPLLLPFCLPFLLSSFFLCWVDSFLVFAQVDARSGNIAWHPGLVACFVVASNLILLLQADAIMGQSDHNHPMADSHSPSPRPILSPTFTVGIWGSGGRSMVWLTNMTASHQPAEATSTNHLGFPCPVGAAPRTAKVQNWRGAGCMPTRLYLLFVSLLLLLLSQLHLQIRDAMQCHTYNACNTCMQWGENRKEKKEQMQLTTVPSSVPFVVSPRPLLGSRKNIPLVVAGVQEALVKMMRFASSATVRVSSASAQELLRPYYVPPGLAVAGPTWLTWRTGSRCPRLIVGASRKGRGGRCVVRGPRSSLLLDPVPGLLKSFA